MDAPFDFYITNNMFDETKLFVAAPGGHGAKRRRTVAHATEITWATHAGGKNVEDTPIIRPPALVKSCTAAASAAVVGQPTDPWGIAPLQTHCVEPASLAFSQAPIPMLSTRRSPIRSRSMLTNRIGLDTKAVLPPRRPHPPLALLQPASPQAPLPLPMTLWQVPLLLGRPHARPHPCPTPMPAGAVPAHTTDWCSHGPQVGRHRFTPIFLHIAANTKRALRLRK